MQSSQPQYQYSQQQQTQRQPRLLLKQGMTQNISDQSQFRQTQYTAVREQKPVQKYQQQYPQQQMQQGVQNFSENTATMFTQQQIRGSLERLKLQIDEKVDHLEQKMDMLNDNMINLRQELNEIRAEMKEKQNAAKNDTKTADL